MSWKRHEFKKILRTSFTRWLPVQLFPTSWFWRKIYIFGYKSKGKWSRTRAWPRYPCVRPLAPYPWTGHVFAGPRRRVSPRGRKWRYSPSVIPRPIPARRPRWLLIRGVNPSRCIRHSDPEAERSTSGLAPWSNPKANPVSNRAIHLYLKSRIQPCIRYPRKINSSNATWKGMKISITMHIMMKLIGWNWNTRLDVSPNPYCAPSRTIVRSPHMAAPKNTRFTSKRFLPGVYPSVFYDGNISRIIKGRQHPRQTWITWEPNLSSCSWPLEYYLFRHLVFRDSWWCYKRLTGLTLLHRSKHDDERENVKIPFVVASVWLL